MMLHRLSRAIVAPERERRNGRSWRYDRSPRGRGGIRSNTRRTRPERALDPVGSSPIKREHSSDGNDRVSTSELTPADQ